MRAVRMVAKFVVNAIRRVVRELHWALPGGPGRAHPWEQVDDIERRRRRDAEIWRQGTDE
jgi:hypothetical protein